MVSVLPPLELKSWKSLCPKKKAFLQEWFINGNNGTQAAIKAGYSKNCAAVTACKLLQEPSVQFAIRMMNRRVAKHYKAKMSEVWEKMYCCLARDVANYFDKTGATVPPNLLPERERTAINGFKQKVRSWTDDNGIEHKEVTTEVQLANIVSVADLIMKAKGYYSENNKSEVTHKMAFDYAQLYGMSPEDIADDIIEVEAEPKNIEQTNGHATKRRKK